MLFGKRSESKTKRALVRFYSEINENGEKASSVSELRRAVSLWSIREVAKRALKASSSTVANYRLKLSHQTKSGRHTDKTSSPSADHPQIVSNLFNKTRCLQRQKILDSSYLKMRTVFHNFFMKNCSHLQLSLTRQLFAERLCSTGTKLKNFKSTKERKTK